MISTSFSASSPLSSPRYDKVYKTYSSSYCPSKTSALLYNSSYRSSSIISSLPLSYSYNPAICCSFYLQSICSWDSCFSNCTWFRSNTLIYTYIWLTSSLLSCWILMICLSLSCKMEQRCSSYSCAFCFSRISSLKSICAFIISCK